MRELSGRQRRVSLDDVTLAALRQGVPVHVVAARLGHADPSVTLWVCAHVILQQAAEVTDRFALLPQDGDHAPESSPEDDHGDDSAEGR